MYDVIMSEPSLECNQNSQYFLTITLYKNHRMFLHVIEINIV